MATITRLTMIKFLELVLVFVLLVLDWNSFYHGADSHKLHTLIVVGTFGGYFIILVGLFVGGLMGTPVNRRVDLIFSAVGCVLFFIAGLMTILVIQNTLSIIYPNTGVGYTKGVAAFVEAVLLLIDAVLTFRGEA